MAVGELDLGLCLTSGQTFRWRRSGDAWEGVDGPFAWRLRQTPVGVEAEGTGSLADLARFLRLDRSREDLVGRIRRDLPLAAVSAEVCPGLRLLRPSCPVEALVSFLCTSNNHLPRIASMVGWLAGLGEEIAWGLRRFPTLERVAELGEHELRSAGFGYRAATIPRAAQAVLARGAEAWLEELRGAPYSHAWRSLMELPGVGPKIADCIALYALDHGEAVPVDVHLWRGAARRLRPEWVGVSLTPRRYAEVGALFRDALGADAGWAHLLVYFEDLRS